MMGRSSHLRALICSFQARMLFDLADDPEQLHNVFAAQRLPPQRARLHELHARLRAEVRCSGGRCT
jgi:hypothetical protein